MKRFVLSVIACVCVSIGMQAAINVLTTNINGQDGYEINGWENPGEIAAFLNGTYSGDVINNGSPDANWATTLLPTIKSAKAIKLGSGASSESIGTADLQALALLTNVVYLRMDSSSPAADADFSQIAIGSSALLDVTLPTGVTKAQVVQANTALKTTATGLKLTTGVAGTIEITQVPHYWYTLPGSTTPIEYTGDVVEGQTTVSVTDYAVMADLTLVEGFPKYSYVNIKNNNNSYEVDYTYLNNHIVNVWGNDCFVPSPIDVKLTPGSETKYFVEIEGVVYEFGWDISANLNYDSETEKYTLNAWTYNNSKGASIAPGSEVTIETLPIYTYTWRENGNEVPKTYTGQIPEPNESGEYIVSIENNYDGNNGYKFDYTPAYKYIYIDKEGVTQTLTQETADEDGKIQIDTYTGELALTTTYESVTNVIVEGVVACVNVVGSLSDATEFLYTGDQETIYKSGETITVIGTVNGDDLSYLSAANFASAKLIDVSETILDGSSTYGSLNDAPLTAALFLPNSVTKDELITLETSKTQNDSGHTCAYVANEDENGNRLMHVYAWDATVANLKPVVDNQTGLYFLKRYTSEGDAWAGAVYTSGNESFRLALAELPAISMDFTNYNAIMMPDFSHLSANTHYLVVPQNTADGLDAHNFTLDTNASNYKYTNDVWVVSTYKAVGVSATYADKTLTATETTNITYFRTADKLAGAAPFLSDQQKTASLQIFVTKDGVQLSENDMEAMKYVECNKMNFLDANVADESYIMFKNPFVKYVALPDNKNYLIRNNVILDDNTNKYTNPFPYLTNLKSVASYNTDYNLYTAYSSLNLDDNNKQIASVGYVTEMIKPSTASDRIQKNSTFAAGLTHMEMMGYFTPEDLSTDGDYYAHAGLNNATVEWIDLSKAYFPNHPDDMAFAYNAAVSGSINNHYGWDNRFFYHIDLPTHKDMNELPPAFLDNMSVLGGGPTHNSIDDGATSEWHSLYTFDYPEPGTTYEGVCIPSNVEYIRTYAFNGCNRLNHIYTTAASNDARLGVDAGAYDNGQNTFTFSTNLKEIETGAFWCGGDNGSGHDGVWSVYPLSKQAPKCQTRSFSPKVLVNKNGFNPAHPICIDSYQDGQQGMAILRYPNGLPDDLEKLYTDITRIFSLADETGATDGDGNLIYWPTQTEFDRAYQQGQLGYIWEDWDMTMLWGQYQKMVHGFGTDDVSDFAATTQSEFVVSGDGVHYSYQDFLDDMTALRAYFKDYIGWHEFVLAWPGRTYNQDTQKDEEYVELDWYTLCVPVDMTVADVAKYMGVVKASTDPNVVNKYVYKTQKINRNNSEETAFGDATTKTLVTWDYVLPDIRQLKSIERNLVNGNINIHLSLDLAGQYPFEQKIMVPSTIKKDASVEGNEESRFTFAYNDYVNAANADTAVIIKGGFPYLVKPIVPISMQENYPGPGKFIMARLDVNDEKYDYKQGKNYFGYYKEFNGNKVRLPYEEYLLQATNPANSGAKEFVENDESKGEYLYNFIGRYVEDIIPKYSYYMGVSKTGVHKFYRATTTSKKWSAFSAIITPLGKATYSYGEVGEKTSESDGKQTSYDTKYEGTTDDTVSQEGYGKFTFIFDDTMDEMVGETDGIKTINDQTTVANAEKVYSVNGQYVGKSLQGLGKGLYIMNGKKYVIK